LSKGDLTDANAGHSERLFRGLILVVRITPRRITEQFEEFVAI